MMSKVVAGDYTGIIMYENAKKGLVIKDEGLLGKKKAFINKETVDHYEVVDEESSKSFLQVPHQPKTRKSIGSLSLSRTERESCARWTKTITKHSLKCCSELHRKSSLHTERAFLFSICFSL